MERRRTIRLLTGKALVALGRPDGRLLGAGWPLLDISEGGLRFSIPKDHPNPPKADEEVTVTVEFVAEGKSGDTGEKVGEKGKSADRFQLQAVVRRVADSDEGEVQDVSLEFLDPSPKHRERLRGAVLDLAMEKIARHRETLAGSIAPEGGRPEGSRLGDILVAQSAVSEAELEKFLAEDHEKDTPIGRQLVKHGLVEEADVARALAEQAELPYADLEMEGIDLLRIRQFTEGYLTQHLFVPLAVESTRVTIASANPLPEEAIADIRKRYSRTVSNVISSERQIMSALQKAFHISRNQRRSARFPAGLSLRYKFYDKDWKPVHQDVLFGLTKNLSDSGVLFVGPLPPGMDAAPSAEKEVHIGLHLFLPNQPEPVRAPCLLVRATVVRGKNAGDGAGPLCLYAVKVLGVSDDDRRRLNLFRFQSYLPRQQRGAKA
jgi:hypothetical protein